MTTFAIAMPAWLRKPEFYETRVKRFLNSLPDHDINVVIRAQDYPHLMIATDNPHNVSELCAKKTSKGYDPMPKFLAAELAGTRADFVYVVDDDFVFDDYDEFLSYINPLMELMIEQNVSVASITHIDAKWNVVDGEYTLGDVYSEDKVLCNTREGYLIKSTFTEDIQVRYERLGTICDDLGIAYLALQDEGKYYKAYVSGVRHLHFTKRAEKTYTNTEESADIWATHVLTSEAATPFKYPLIESELDKTKSARVGRVKVANLKDSHG